MNLKTLALVGALAALTGLFAIRAADAPATPQPDAAGRRGGQGFRQPGFQNLTPEEQEKFKAASETARKDPKVQAAQEKMTAALKELREATDAAILAADPSVEPILKKLQEAREKARAAGPRGGATDAPKPAQ
jgi:Spy/CpxP family protein refolding chaperone